MTPVLYALGSNGSGQLGLGHRDDVNKPIACLFYEKPPPERRPCAVAAGGNHTLILCKDGAVYASGENGDGRCGVVVPACDHIRQSPGADAEAQSQCITQFHNVIFPDSSIGANKDHNLVERFSHVSATWSASFFATRTAIYSAGTGLKGELGIELKTTCTKSKYPIKISNFPPPNTEILHLTSGVHHTIATLSNGEVYGWGTARHGELGEPRMPFVMIPRRIDEVDFHACGAVAGLNWTYIFSAPANDRLGNTNPFQHLSLGNDKHGLQTLLPNAQALGNYASITSSWSSVYVLLRSGTVVSWGRCSNDKDPSKTPRNLPQVDTIVAGSEHVLAKGMSGGEVRAWGWGEHGNCGEGWGEKNNKADDVRTNEDGKELRVSRRIECLEQSKSLWNVLRVPNYICGPSTTTHFIPIGAGCATSWLFLTDGSTMT